MEQNKNKKPNPIKDQHFMVDKMMLELIFDAATIEPGETIVEIGGGEGALTDYLAVNDNFVTVIEKDPYYANYLKEKYKDNLNINVIEGDALSFDYSSFDRIIANLPYTITEPFLQNLASSGALDYSPTKKGSNLKKVTLVLSQNSLRKMFAPIQITEGNARYENKEFGLIGAISKVFNDIDVITAIPSTSFYPEPAVTSFLINITPKKNKTTVDRIIREMLVDKKGNRPATTRVYQTMIAQEKIYKVSKNKNKIYETHAKNPISSVIGNKNIYELNNSQISKLFQELIRNDINIKTKNNDKRRVDYLNSNYDYNNLSIGDYYDEVDTYEEQMMYQDKTKKRKNIVSKYDYMYESERYLVLLNRGLEFIEPKELQLMLNSNFNSEVDDFLNKKR